MTSKKIIEGLLRECDPCGCRSREQLTAELARIFAEHEAGSEADAGFDGGEFSGPEHSRMLARALEDFQARHNLSDAEMHALTHDEP
jgi:hypothetical protein